MKKALLFMFIFALTFGIHADDASKKKVSKDSDDKFCVVPEDGNSNQTTFVFTKSDDSKKQNKETKKDKKDGESCSTDKDSKEKSCCSTDKKKSETKQDPKK